MNERELLIMESFDHHSPSANKSAIIEANRGWYKFLVKFIFDNVKDSADRTAGLRQLHESMMTINKSIILEKE